MKTSRLDGGTRLDFSHREAWRRLSQMCGT